MYIPVNHLKRKRKANIIKNVDTWLSFLKFIYIYLLLPIFFLTQELLLSTALKSPGKYTLLWSAWLISLQPQQVTEGILTWLIKSLFLKNSMMKTFDCCSSGQTRVVWSPHALLSLILYYRYISILNLYFPSHSLKEREQYTCCCCCCC